MFKAIQTIFLFHKHRILFVFLKYFFALGISGCLVVTGLFLLFPILKTPEKIALEAIPYQVTLPFDQQIFFALHWSLPFVIVLTSVLGLLVSKRLEYEITRTGYDVTKMKTASVLSGQSLSPKQERVLESCCLAAGTTLRLSALLLLGGLQVVIASLALATISRFAVAIAILSTVLTMLALALLSARHRDASEAGDLGGARPDAFIANRIQLSDAGQAFSGIMPLGILSLLISTRLFDAVQLDLAQLVVIALLLSMLGQGMSRIIQQTLKFARQGDLLPNMLDALQALDRSTLLDLLAKSPSRSASDDERD